MGKPVIYIASPYTKGDAAINTRFQCEVFDKLMTDGRVLPVAPLWTHFQHIIFPRKYEEWVQYDLDMLHLYDGCLRLAAEYSELHYYQLESTGADGEVQAFKDMGKPVFYSYGQLFDWVNINGK